MGNLRSIVVVFGAFLNLFVSAGYQQSMGLFVVEWQEEFEGSSAEEIGWIFSFSLIGYGVAGLFIVVLGSRISCRTITILGGVLTCISISCAIFCREIWHMFLVMFVSGFGSALSNTGTLTVIGFHVKKRVGVAYGFVTAGSSFGLLTLSPLFTFLIDTYSWRGALLITSSILAHQCVIGALFRQTTSETTANRVKAFYNDDVKSRMTSERPSNGIKLREPRASWTFGYAFYGYPFIEGRRTSSINLIRGRIRKSSIQLANGIKHSNTVAIFKNIRLLSFYVSMFLRGFAYYACTVNFVALCVDSGISKVDAAFLLSLMGICGAIARLSHGILIDKKLVTALNFQSSAQLSAGIACILVGISSKFVTLAIFVIVFGAACGIFMASTLNAMRQIIDIHMIKGCLGIYMTVSCVGGLLGVPASGKLFDITNSYSTSYYLAGGLFIISSILHFMDHLLVAYQQRPRRICGISKDQSEFDRNGFTSSNV